MCFSERIKWANVGKILITFLGSTNSSYWFYLWLIWSKAPLLSYGSLPVSFTTHTIPYCRVLKGGSQYVPPGPIISAPSGNWLELWHWTSAICVMITLSGEFDTHWRLMTTENICLRLSQMHLPKGELWDFTPDQLEKGSCNLPG